MKKILLLSAILAGSLLINKSAEAQLRVHVNINPFPSREHSGYDPYWRRHEEIVFDNDRGYRHGHRRDYDERNRDWNRNDDNRWNDRRGHDGGYDNDHHGDDRNNGHYDDHGGRGRGRH